MRSRCSHVSTDLEDRSTVFVRALREGCFEPVGAAVKDGAQAKS